MTVLQTKRGPCEINWQECRASKYAVSGDAVDRSLEPKDEQLTRRQRIEAQAPTWLPMVDLVKRLMLREEVEPRQVGVGDEKPDHARPVAPFAWMVAESVSWVNHRKLRKLSKVLLGSSRSFRSSGDAPLTTAAAGARPRRRAGGRGAGSARRR